MARQLASHCSVGSWDGRELRLDVDPACQSLIGSKAERGLGEALQRWFGKPVSLKLAINSASADAETPAQREARQAAARQEAAMGAMREDPVVQAVVEHFDGELVEDSIRPN
jgi:DNA polymerase-3 subunit gamma/tau